MTARWFEVDRAGLRKLLERRGLAFVLYELLANAWDAPGCARVDVDVEPVAGRPRVRLRVFDDSPAGFADLTHAWTLFAESSRKGDPERRGRWNLGEKLVLSMCESAEVVSTSGGVRFDVDGRHPIRRRLERGSEFVGLVYATHAQADELVAAATRVVPPRDVTVVFNGAVLGVPRRLTVFCASLPTEVADEEGVLRRARRLGQVEVLEAVPGATPWLLELGVPVCETDFPWTVNVGQKVPLNLDRTGVAPGFLRDLRVEVLNHALDVVPDAAAADPWVREAAASPKAEPLVVGALLRRRFGSEAVAADPSDPEGTKLSVAAGRPVVHGGALSAGEWANARRAGVLPPAGQVTPSPRVACAADGTPPVAHDKWLPLWRRRADDARRLSRAFLGFEVGVEFQLRVSGLNAAAWYGSRTITFHVGLLGPEWFGRPLADEGVLSLLLHEFAHEVDPDHLSERYQEACCDLGARLALAVLADPALLAEREVAP